MKFVVNLSHICPTIVFHSAFFGEVCNYLYQNHESRFVNNLTESATLLSLVPHPKNVARPAGVAGKSKPLPAPQIGSHARSYSGKSRSSLPSLFDMIPDFSRCSTLVQVSTSPYCEQYARTCQGQLAKGSRHLSTQSKRGTDQIRSSSGAVYIGSVDVLLWTIRRTYRLLCYAPRLRGKKVTLRLVSFASAI